MKIEIVPLDKKRYDAFIQQSRSPDATCFGEELSWWATSDESVIGIVIRGTTDNDFLGIVSGRDEAGQFRCCDISPTSFKTSKDAEYWLHSALKRHGRDGNRIFPQGDADASKNVCFFTQIVSDDQLHPYFRIFKDNDVYYSAREIIKLKAAHFKDIDGNFVQQFQTQGFDARLWELFIDSYLVEEDLVINRDHNSPDFIVEKYGHKVGIEAVTVGRKDDNPVNYSNPDLKKSIDVRMEHENAMPIRFGSALFSKLKKEYWKLPQIKNSPLMFAIADFHDNQSMLWSGTALINYLYGIKHDSRYDQAGNLIIEPISIEKHKLENKEIPSGFFFQPDAENVSAVMFSATGTVSKFNRMGRQAGFKHPDVTIFRVGCCNDPDKNASLPKIFSYEVDETGTETWAEGISIFHNPNAKNPIPIELFPSVTHHWLINDQIVSHISNVHVFSSRDLNFLNKNTKK